MSSSNLCSPERGRMVRIPTTQGLHASQIRVLDLVAPYTEQNIVYVNCTSASGLLRAVEASSQKWVQSQERMERFHYHRVNGICELAKLLEKNEFDVVILERTDEILRGSGAELYEEQNHALHRALATDAEYVFLDDWEYLDRYYHRDLDSYMAPKRRRPDGV
ncbi:hypothetical protein PUMCH_005129 [Australozyma saopauloensis]|uniref:Uncharacterized protein n=1 Tax=Australozyma saopauloensis TaxID=291208 RepID=A0AAX4HHM8_9ASCO|nr:hypothetical protein PUMCH_005129 [[Candida] saopauloensis]